MATPHVAGSAALLAQLHPDWRAEQLKSALMSTAAPGAGIDVYGQGAGRVDADRATAQTVYATGGSVNFGILHWPYTGQPPASRSVTYSNDGDAPVTLVLSLAGPAPMLALGATTVTVPAKGTATVPVNLTPTAAPGPGALSGRLVATAPGGLTVQTAIGVTAEPESYAVTVKLIDRLGRPGADALDQYGVLVDEHGIATDLAFEGGTATVRLPKGTYSALGLVTTASGATRDGTVGMVPVITADHDQTVTLDARTGRKVTVRADRNSAVTRILQVDLLRPGWFGGWPATFSLPTGQDLYAIPVTAKPGTFSFGLTAELTAGSDAAYHLAFASRDRIPTGLSFRVHDRQLARVDTNYRAQGAPALASRATNSYPLPGQNASFGAYLDLPLPSRRVEYYSPAPVRYAASIIQRPLDQPRPSSDDGQVASLAHSYRAGQRTSEDWNRAVFGPELQQWQLGSNLIGRLGDDLIAQAWLFAPNEPGHSAFTNTQLPFVTGSTALSRGGEDLAVSDAPGYLTYEGLPAEPGRYMLRTTATRDSAWSKLSTRVDTAWTFDSGHVDGDAPVFLPLLTVRATGTLDDLNRAPAGRYRLDLRAETQNGVKSPPPVTGVSLDYSTDDGATWNAAPVTGIGATRRAVVTNPAGGYVSLRMAATNAAGGRVDQTIIRAYAVSDSL